MCEIDKKYYLKHFLMASPYNIDTNLEGELSEEIFQNDYLVIPETYNILNERMNAALNSNSNPAPTTTFLFGYSGIGKTTYIKWYADKYLGNYNKILFDLADAVPDDHSCELCLKLFDDYFCDLLCDLCHEKTAVMHELITTLFNLELKIAKTFSDKFFDKIENYINETKNSNADSSAFRKLASGSSYKDLMMLLLFFYYYFPEIFSKYFNIIIDERLPLLIIFDNIDHVKIEHYNAEFPKDIEIIYQKMKKFIQKNTKITINKRIHFLFCLRDANCSLINCQLADITSRSNIEFIPIKEESEIFRKRIQIAKNHKVQVNQNQDAFLDFIFEDRYTKQLFLPLFNFNLRKFAEFICDTTQESVPTCINSIRELSKYKATKVGARGIEYYLIIKQLLKNDFLKETLFLSDGYLKPEYACGFVNPTRILLTNIHNKSHYSLDEYTRTSNGKSVGLYNLYCSFDEIFKGEFDLFFEILTNLFLFHKDNWCHLITFMNKPVFSETSFNTEKELLKSVVDASNISIASDINKLNKKINDLNEIKVRLNPAGFVYIKDITRHYEFFSVRAGNDNPLYCTLNQNSGKDSEFEFITNIQRTFTIVKKCITRLITFLNVWSGDNFGFTDHCFRTHNDSDILEDDSRRQSGLHSIRIIDTHINYIDSFRLFILNNDKYFYLQNIRDIKTVKININKKIIEIIEQYISFLIQINEGSIHTTDNLVSIFNKNVHIIKQSGYSDFITSINKDRTSDSI